MIIGVIEIAHLAQIYRQLVEQDQYGLAAEQLAQGLGAGRDAALVAVADARVSVLAGQGISNLAPGRMREHAVAHGPAIGRIGILPIESRDADISFRQQGGIDELLDTGHAIHAPSGMGQRDQPVGLAAAVGGIEPENRCDLPARAGQPPAHVGEQVLEAPGGIGVGEEAGRVTVFLVSPADDDLGQIRREISLGNAPLQDVCARPASLENRGDRHIFCSTRSPRLFGPTAFDSVHWSISVFRNRHEPPTLNPGISRLATSR